MMIVFRSLRCAILVVAFFLTVILATGCATDQASVSGEMTSMELEPYNLFAAFEQMHGEILTRVQEGTLPADVGDEADELKIALEKYLITTQAQLKILQLDVLDGADDQREAALEQVIALAAKRERTKMAYLQRLQALNIAHLPGEKTTGKGKVKDIKIEIVPEDISEGERP